MARRSPSGEGTDSVEAPADAVPARSVPRSRRASEEADPGSTVTAVDDRGVTTTFRRAARPGQRPVSATASETPAVPMPRPVDLEVPARRHDRIETGVPSGESDQPDVWAVAAAPSSTAPTAAPPTETPREAVSFLRDAGRADYDTADVLVPTEEPTSPAPAVRAEPATERVVPLTGVPVPVVVPSTPVEAAPAAVPTVGPIVAVPPTPKRKDRPKTIRLPRRARVRKVSRVVRSIDAWSVFKVSIVFYLAMYVVFLVAGVLLWNVAYSTGTIDNISSFFESFGWTSFEFNGGEIYHNAWIIGLFAVAGLTGLNVVLATLYNLITDLVGGIRLTVLEEEVLVRAAPLTTEGTLADRPTSTATVKLSRKDRRRAKRQTSS